ncbi:FAD-dependent oxidoreductase [Acinetobacter sp. c2-A9]|uniref:FAD-dependent oxidoreductase n=1 Tax=Acinetobacter sp. c2-A9 TaxID=3342802 RepID=UPI0035B73D07
MYNLTKLLLLFQTYFVKKVFPIKSLKSIAIIGGGIAGSTIALRLAHLGLNVHLFEKNNSLVSGPPMCHLHAGGNMYRELSDEDCRTLLRQGIDTVHLYPHSIDARPTLIAVPCRDDGHPETLLPRLKMLKDYYQQLIAENPKNAIFDEYYHVYERADLDRLKTLSTVKTPISADDWMINFVHVTDLDQLKYPVILVNEYSWNIFQLSASVSSYLLLLNTVHLHFQSKVQHIQQQSDKTWQISYQQTNHDVVDNLTLNVDFMINAAGFLTGQIDDQANVKIERMVEFKAAYLSRWDKCDDANHILALPEMVFHGERGTPTGMAQFTPYAGGYVQLHGMSNEITLFDDGLHHSTAESNQPYVNPTYVNYINQGWDENVPAKRTQRAIEFLTVFIPEFSNAKPYHRALFGAQQVPDDDIAVRVGSVEIDANKNYATVQNVKASSALDIADKIAKHLYDLAWIESDARPHQWYDLDKNQVTALAKQTAEQRGYDKVLAEIDFPLNITQTHNVSLSLDDSQPIDYQANATTMQAIADFRQGRVKQYKNINALRDKLNKKH